ncbi:DUF1318 domain-containing protein [Methylacidimicrobium sp. AP8]|uniref:DUF1318 domain-containing protein n=1 Tax=Methylacidimicrobium sp. AP8 TaxID=2730359 RepID=UPI0019243E57|nr:DUF1318 domain-containing protein [Methylacidimicrobium sp. AP8]
MSACAPLYLHSPKPLLFDVDLDTEIRSPPLQSGAAAPANLQERRRTHMAEVQALKNARIIGETSNGYLQIVAEPAEAGYRSYIHRIVEEENRARYLLYASEAKKLGETLSGVEARYAERWQDNAFPGELIQKPDGSWIAKPDPAEG